MLELRDQHDPLLSGRRDLRQAESADLDAPGRLSFEQWSLSYRLKLLIIPLFLLGIYGFPVVSVAGLMAGATVASYSVIRVLLSYAPETLLRVQLALRLLDVALISVVLNALESFTGQPHYSALYILPVTVAAGANGGRGALAIAAASTTAMALGLLWLASAGVIILEWHILFSVLFYGTLFFASGLVVTYFMRLSAAVTERHQRALRASEQRYRELFENASDVIFTLDLPGNFTSMNRAGERITGFEQSEALQMNIAQLLVPAYQGFVRPMTEQQDVEVEIVTKDGRLRWLAVSTQLILAHGRPVGVQGIGRDITERKRMEEALRQSESRYRTLIEMMSEGVMQVDNDDVIQFVNQRYCDIIGYAQDELLGKVATDLLVVPQDRHVIQEKNLLRLEKVRDRYEVQVRKKTGDLLWLEIGGAPVIDAQGNVVGSIGIQTDITQRRWAEEEREHLYRQLAEREERLQELVGKLLLAHEEERRRVAYEVHDGLAQVAWAAQQYLEAFAGHYRPRTVRAQQELSRARELAQRTVNEARRVIAGLRPTVLDDFGLEAALRVETEGLRSEGWHVAYEWGGGEERLPALVETALYRVAQEALANVRKHAHSLRVRVGLWREGEQVRLEVQDWGEGFVVEEILGAGGGNERVGLASMQERVSLLGGQFRVESEPGVGTRVQAEVSLSGTPGRAREDGQPGASSATAVRG